tara:strand:+ start:763 stop:1041 length:279 start_codon:yes stop_codon:yes gene_type:complete
MLSFDIRDWTLSKIDPSSGDGGVSGVDVGRFREVMILNGHLSEMKTGMRMSRHVDKCSTIIRREYGFKGNNVKLAEQLFAHLVEQGVLVRKS